MSEHQFEEVEHADPWREGGARADALPTRLSEQTLRLGRGPLDPSAVLRLQQSAGNARVGRLVARRTAGEEVEDSPVRAVIDRSGAGGLPVETRRLMEHRMGADFSDVRIHTDTLASRSAQSVGANAYTVGNNIVFREGHYAPGSDAGRHTLAHELTHVVQQRHGPVDGAPAAGGIRISDPGDRFEREAEANADSVMRSPSTSTQESSPVDPAAAQREESDEDEVQEIAAQREESDEDEVQEIAAQREESDEDEVQEIAAQREESDEDEVQEKT